VEQQTVDPKAIAKSSSGCRRGRWRSSTAAPDAPTSCRPRAEVPGPHPGGLAEGPYDLVRAYCTQLERAAAQRPPWADDGPEASPRRGATKEIRKLADTFGPIELELGTHKDLILFPNDLSSTPIHALTRKQADGTRHLLAETHRVSYVTQLELVDLPRFQMAR
jgi:hypothetical protein